MSTTNPTNFNKFQIASDPFDVDMNLEIKEFAIGGKLVFSEMRINEYEYMSNIDSEAWKDQVRHRVTLKLVGAIIEKGLVNFTTVKDLQTADQIVRVYAYLAPDSNIKVLRQVNMK
jgi:hypothetical protein